ncbi:MAG: histidine kinase [Chloroflexota bacterium]
MSDVTFENPTDELINQINMEIASLKRRQEEIEGQIDQYEKMVQREEKRNADVATAVKVMKDQLEAMPREDIRDKYEEAMDAKFRLATMRGQLEQFKGTQDFIRNERRLLAEVLSKVQGGIVVSDDDDDDPAMAASSLNMVRIVKAQEDERRRLANQIHDGPAQSLTNFMLQAEIVQRLFDRDQESAKDELNNLKEAASLTFQRVRDFISDLRPMMLDDLGLIPTVRRYIESFSNKSDIAITENINGAEDRRLEEYQEVMLFRGLQDLMAHARDFADATQIDIRVDIDTYDATIIVEDNGRPFDPEEGMSGEHADDPRTQGILTLREKFDLVKGNLAITGGEGEPTTIRIEMPITDRIG